jgi:FtsZ-binding cell division protein ZapB
MKINNPFETYSRGMTARERRIRSRWALMFVISSLIAIWLMVKVSNQENEIEKLALEIEELSQKNLELQGEYFNASTVNGRYELSLEFLKEIDSVAAKEFEEFYDHQTE